jgi:hypothetical protein
MFYKLPRPLSLRVKSPARENFHGRTGNRTRDLMVSSQNFWPSNHETGRFSSECNEQIQNDQKVSVQLIITVQKKNARKNILNSFNHLP